MESLAATGVTLGTSAPISILGSLLMYGIPGLATAVLLMSYYSLHSLQRQALKDGLPPSKVGPFIKLQQYYLLASVVVLCVSIVSAYVMRSEGKATFSMSPTDFEDEKFRPHLTMASGTPLIFKGGVAEDISTHDRRYHIKVDPLVSEIVRLKALTDRNQLVNATRADGTQDALANR